jgi:hypothetical protein
MFHEFMITLNCIPSLVSVLFDTPNINSPAEKAEHHYYLKIYRPGVWLLFFDQIQVFLCIDKSLETF